MACVLIRNMMYCVVGAILLGWSITNAEPFEQMERKLGIFDSAMYMSMSNVIQKFISPPGIVLKLINLPAVPDDRLGYRKAFSSVNISTVDAVIGPYNKAYAAVTEKRKIPFVVTSTTPRDQHETPFLIQLFPDAHVFANAVLDIVNYYQYSEIAVIYDSNEGAIILEKILLQPPKEGISIKINDPTISIKQELKAIRDKGYLNFIIVSKNINNTEKVLKESLRLSMFSHPYTWLLVNMGLEEYNLDKYVDSKVNLTVLDLTADPDSNSCNLGRGITSKKAVLSDAIQVSLHINRNGSKIQKSIMSNTVGNFDLHGCTGHLNFTMNGKRSESSLRLLEIRNYRSGKAGSWSNIEADVADRVKPSQSYSRSKGLMDGNIFDSPIRITTKIEPPFVQFKNESNFKSGDPNQIFEGLLIDIIEELAKKLNFEYNMSLVPDGKFGSKKPYGWTGMVRVLKDGHADLALAPFQITPDRSTVVDFTKPFMTKGTTVMVRRPEFTVGHFQFLRPLSKYVWIAIFVAFVVVSLVLFGVSRVNADKHAKYTHNLRASFWYIWGTLLRGSLCGAPQAISSRTISSAWWFFSLIITSIYTANLAAFLTITISSLGINSAADLAQQDLLQYGTVDGSQIEYFFNHTKMDHYAKMKAMMSVQPDWMVRTVDIGFDRVMQGGYAFIWDSPTIRHLVSSDCRLMEIGTPFDLKGYGLAVRKNAPYLEKISLAILKLIDDGVVYHLEGKWWRRQYCPDPRQKAKTKSLDLENVAGMFIILASGIVLALLICGIEMCVCGHSSLIIPSRRRASSAGNVHHSVHHTRNSEFIEDKPDMLGDIQVSAYRAESETNGPYKRYSDYESRI